MKVHPALRSYWLPVALALLPCCLIAQSDRIIQPIDGKATVLLKGSLSPRIRSATDRGPVDGSLTIPAMELVFRRTAAQDANLQELLQEQQDSTSPNFHRWLHPEEYADRFGLSQLDMSRVISWLELEGFTVKYRPRGRTFIFFSGTAEQVKATFHAEIHDYDVRGVVSVF